MGKKLKLVSDVEPGALTEQAAVDPKKTALVSDVENPTTVIPGKNYFLPLNQQVPESKYESGFVFGEKPEPHFAQRQGKLAEAGNAVAQVALGFIPGVLGQAGAIADVEDWSAGIVNFDDEVGNALTRWSQQAKEGIQEDFPVYQQDPEKKMNLGSSEWWFKNGASVVGSATEFAALGWGLGSLISKGLSASKWLSAVDAATGGTVLNQAGQAIAVPANAFLLNHAESILDATQTYDNYYKQAVEAGKDESEAKLIASQAAAHNININRANILLNLTSVGALMKGSKGARNLIKPNSLLKTTAFEGGQEYLEESVNYFAQNRASEYGNSLITGSKYTGPTLDKLLSDMATAEGVEAGFLGLIGGVAQTGFTGVINRLRGSDKEEQKMIEKQMAQLQEYDKFRKNNNLANIETVSKNANTQLALINARNEVQKSIEEDIANNKKPETKKIIELNSINRAILANQAYQNFELGTTEYLEKAYQDVANLSDEEAAKNGFTGEELNPKSELYYKTKAEGYLKDIKALENAYNKASTYLNAAEVFNLKALELEQTRQLEVFNNVLTEQRVEAQNALNKLQRTGKLFGFSGSLNIDELLSPVYFTQVGNINDPEEVNQRKTLINKAKELDPVKDYLKTSELINSLQKEIDHTQDEYAKQTSSKVQTELQNKRKADLAEEAKLQREAEVQAKKVDQAITLTNDKSTKIASEPVTKAKQDLQKELPINVDLDPDSTLEFEEVQDIAIKQLDDPNYVLTDLEQELVNKHKELFDMIIKRNLEYQAQQSEQHVNATAADPLNTTDTDVRELKNIEKELTSFPIKAVINPEADENDKKGKLNQAYNTIAYLSRNYSLTTDPVSLNKLYTDVDNNLNSALQDPRILDNKFIDVGDRVTLEIDNTGIVEQADGSIKTWDEVKNDKLYTSNPAAVINDIPIAIKKDGSIIGYLHLPRWITPDRVKGNIANDKQNLINLRSSVYSATKPVQATVTVRTPGKLFIDYTKQPNPVSINLPDTKLEFAVFYRQELTDGRTRGNVTKFNDYKILNRNNLKEGRSYVLLPVKRSRKINKLTQPTEYFAVGLIPNKLSEPVINSIGKATEIFYNVLENKKLSQEEQNIVEQLKEINKSVRVDGNPVNFDITTAEGLKNYLDLFIYSNNKDITQKNQTLDNYLTTTPSLTTDYLAHEVGNKGVFFGRGKVGTVPKGDTKAFIEEFKKHLRDRYFHASLDFFTANIKVPIIDSNNQITSLNNATTYLDHLKSNVWTTNIMGHNISTDANNPNYVYTVQSIIEIEPDKALPVDVIDDETGETIRFDSKIDQLLKTRTGIINEEGQIIPKQLTINPDAEEEVEESEDENSADLPIELTEEEVKLIKNRFKVPGLKAQGERSLINWITGQVNEAFFKDPDISFTAVMNNLKTEFEKLADQSKFATTVVKNWPRVQSLVNYYLRSNFKYDVTDEVIVNNPEDTQELTEEDSSVENWMLNSLSRDPSAGLSENFRRFLGLIENPDRKSIVMGFEKYNPVEIYRKLSSLLADTYPNYEIMTDKLKSLKDQYNFIEPLLIRLDSAGNQLKAEFVVSMSKHYVNMEHVYVVPRYKGFELTGYDTFIRSDNSSNKTIATRDNWISNLYYTTLVKTQDGNFIFDKTKATELADQVLNLDKDTYEKFDLNTWLINLGINLSNKTFEVLKDSGLTNVNKRSNLNTYSKLFLADNGIFKIIAKQLSSIANSTEDIAVENSNLVKESSLFTLAKLDSLYNDLTHSDTHKSGNNYIYSYADNKYLTDRIKELKSNVELLTGLADRSFSKHSWWLKQMLKTSQAADGSIVFERDATGNVILNPASDFNNQFEYNYLSLEVLKQKGKTSSGKKPLEDLSFIDHEKTKFLFFQRAGQWSGKGLRVGEFFMMTLSNKNTMLALKTTVPPVKVNAGGSVSSETIDFLFENTVLPEMQRLWDYKSNHNVQGYTEGSKLFYFYPELNTLDLFNEDGSLKLDAATGENLANIKQVIGNTINKEVLQKLAKWEEYKLITKQGNGVSLNYFDEAYIRFVKSQLPANNKSNTDIANYAATEMVVAYMVNNTNIFQTITTDPATQWKSSETFPKIKQVYDTFENINKRLGGEISPGRDLAKDSINETYNLAVIKDVKLSSRALDKYSQLDPELAKAYKNINSTDAVEFITLAEKINFLRQSGKLTDEQLEELDNIDLDKPLNLRQLNLVLQVDKPIAVGTRIDSNNIETKIYVKSAAFTLIPQFIKGTELEHLDTIMKKYNVDRLAFASAVKLGGPKNIKSVFDSSGNVNPEVELDSSDIFQVDRKYLKLQQETPVKTKTEIARVSQASKLLFVDILDKKNFKLPGSSKTYSGVELKDIYNDYYDQLYRDSYNELLSELNIDPTQPGEWEPNPIKLNKIIQDELVKRNYPPHDLEALEIQIVNDKAEFKIPIWALAKSGKLESFLNSIVNSRIIKQKMNGYSYILASEAGFKFTKQDDKKQIITDLTEISDELKNKIVFTKNFKGELKPALENNYFNQVIVPWKFKENLRNYIDSDGSLNLAKVDPELLKMFGMRIPNQGPNSTAAIEVVGFLPPEAGDMIIAPMDFVTQMGSDFDIDKLYVYMYNYIKSEDGKLSKITERDPDKSPRKYLENKIFDIHISINTNPDVDIQKSILRPVGTEELRDIADKLDEIDKSYQDLSLSPISSTYQSNKYLKSVFAGKAIGAFAVANTFNALTQYVPTLKLIKYVTQEGTPVYSKIKFGREVFDGSTDFSNPRTLNNKEFKSANISKFLSAAVDDEKEQILDKVGINNQTIGTAVFLLQAGFSTKTISYFLKQDIIQEYSRLLTSYGSSFRAEKELFKQARFADVPKIFQQRGKESENVINHTVETQFYDLYNSSQDDLLNYIENKDKAADYKLAQYALLQKFKNISENEVYTIRKVNSALNLDTKGSGKNLFQSIARQSQVERLTALEGNKLENADKLIGDYISKYAADMTPERVEELRKQGYVEGFNYFIKPQTIPGYAAVYGVFTNNKLWSKYFPYTNPNLLSVFREISKNMAVEAEDFLQESDRNQRLFYQVKNYIYSDNNIISEPVKSTRRELLFDYTTLDNNKKPIKNLSLASIFKELTSNPETNKIIKQNKFLRNLFVPSVRSAEEPRVLLFRNPSADEATNFEIYSDVVDSLKNPVKLGVFNNKEYTTKNFIENLAISTLISGTSNLQQDLLQYIPVEYYNLKKISEGLKNYKFSSLLKDKVDLDSITRFTEQYFQHYPQLATELEGRLNDVVNNPVFSIREEEIELPGNKIQLQRIEELASFSLKPDEVVHDFYTRVSPAGKLLLFKLVDKELKTYSRISTLGSNYYHEYNPNVDIATSNIEANNPINQPVIVRKSVQSVKKPVVTSDNIVTAELLDKYDLRPEYYTLTPFEVNNTLNKIALTSANTGFRSVAKFLQDRIKEFDITVISEDLVDAQTELPKRGNTTVKDNKVTVRLNLPALRSAEDIELTLLHELTHAVTMQTINNPKNDRQRRAVRNLNELLNKFKELYYNNKSFAELRKEFENKPGYIAKVYPTKNLNEFVAGVLTQPELQQMLNQIQYSETQTFWDKFLEFLNLILKSFGLDINSTAAKAINDVLILTEQNQDNLLDNKLVELGDEYEGTIDITDGSFISVGSINPNFDKLLFDKLADDENTADLPFDTSNFADKTKSPNKFNKLIQEKKSNLYQLYQRLRELNLAVSKTTTVEEKKNLIARRNKVDEKIIKVTAELDQAKAVVKLEDLVPIAEEELKEVNTLLARSTSLDFQDINIIDKKIKLWKNYADNFLTAEERLTSGITDIFTNILSTANRFSDHLEDIKKQKVLDLANKLAGKKFDQASFYNAIKDISGLASYTLDISNADHALLQVLFENIKRTESLSREELHEVTDQFKDLINKVKDKTNVVGENFSNFFEKDADGNITGNIIMPYSQEYLDSKYKLLREAKAFGEKGDKTKAREAWKTFNKFVKDNELVFDIRKLTSIPGYEQMFKDDAGKLEQLLKQTVGELEYKRKLNRALAHYERYKLDLEVAEDRIKAEYADPVEQKKALKAWKDQYDLFDYLDYRSNEKNNKSNLGWKYSEYTPKAFDATGKPTKWYNQAYKAIQQDEDAVKLHDYIVNLLVKLRRYMPENKYREFHINSLPALQKSIFEAMKTEGMAAAMTTFWDHSKQALTSADVGQLLFNNSPDGRTLTVNLDTISNKIDRIYSQKIDDFIRANDSNPSEAQLKQFKAEATAEAQKTTSLDLINIVGAYTAALVNYHHKSKIEDSVRLMEEVFKSHVKEVKTNARGQEMYRVIEGVPELEVIEGGLKNYTSMLKYTLDRFYQVPKEVEGKTETKTYTKLELERKQKLEDELKTYQSKITDAEKDLDQLRDNSEGMTEENLILKRGRLNDEIEANKKKVKEVEEELNKLGGAVTGSGIWDVMLKYITIKGLGWNVFAGFTNMSFGWISNIVEASAGRYFNEQQINKAYRLTLSSVGKFLTFNQIQTDNAVKIRTLMDNLDVLKRTSEELFQDKIKLQGATKSLHWAHVQNRTEYLNQAPVMIAMMLNKPINKKDGSKSNLWEAYGKQGEWDVTNFGDINTQFSAEERAKFKSALDKVIRKTHGNYDPTASIRIKGSALGRSLSIFRTWMFEGFNSRFEGVSEDEVLGVTRKGRYRSYSGGSLALVGAGVGSLLFPGLGTAIGAGIGLGIGSKLQGKERYLPEYQNMSQFEELAWVTKYLLRKLSFGIAYKNVSLEERFTTVDAMNLRKNMTELSILAYTLGFVMMLRFMVEGEDDDDQKAFLTYTLNIMHRIQQDIGFYADPISFKQIMKDPIPATAVITDLENWMSSAVRYIDGEDEIPTGRFAGQSRLSRASQKLVPGFRQLKTTADLATQEY